MKVFKIKVTLLNHEPEVSRTFLINENSNFDVLGRLIIQHFEWDVSRLWKFETPIPVRFKQRKQDVAEIFPRHNDTHVFEDVSNFLACTLEAKNVRLNLIISVYDPEIDFFYDKKLNLKHSVVITEILEIDETIEYPVFVEGTGTIPKIN